MRQGMLESVLNIQDLLFQGFWVPVCMVLWSTMMTITAVRPCSEELIEAQREKVEEVVQRLRSKLPADKAAQLSSFDSYGLLDLYNHHHTHQDASRLGPTPASGNF